MRRFAGEHRYRRLARGGRIRLLARLRVDNPYAQIAARGLHANVIEPLVIVDAGTSGAELRIFSFQSGSMFSRCALCGVGSTRPVAKPSSSSISAGGIDVHGQTCVVEHESIPLDAPDPFLGGIVGIDHREGVKLLL